MPSSMDILIPCDMQVETSGRDMEGAQALIYRTMVDLPSSIFA